MTGSLKITGMMCAAAAVVIAAGLIALMRAEPPTKDADAPSNHPQTTQPDATTAYERPEPPASFERVGERSAMVEQQIARPRYGGVPINDAAVLKAMRTVPRHVFVPNGLRPRAYDDTPLPIGHGQTISQPYIVALMTELLELTPESKVLEIGTGSGYQAAVLAHLTPHVHTIEIIEALSERAQKALQGQGYEEIRCLHTDGYHGWPEHAPFDAIIVTCASGHLPPPLWEQLKPGGRIVIPIGGPYEVQRLVVIEKNPDGTRASRTVTSVRFVPLTREEKP